MAAKTYMYIPLTVLGLLLYVIHFGSSVTISKRRLDALADMIEAVGNDLDPTQINAYGRWCGLGGSGEPVDELDACCRVHDMCYIYLHSKQGACYTLTGLKVYMEIYNWSMVHGQVMCHDDPDKEECKYLLCDCDRVIANCLADHAHLYNPNYMSNSTFSALLNSVIDFVRKGKDKLTETGWKDIADGLKSGNWDIMKKYLPEKYIKGLESYFPDKFTETREKGEPTMPVEETKDNGTENASSGLISKLVPQKVKDLMLSAVNSVLGLWYNGYYKYDYTT